jgi:hypothetical protein
MDWTRKVNPVNALFRNPPNEPSIAIIVDGGGWSNGD